LEEGLRLGGFAVTSHDFAGSFPSHRRIRAAHCLSTAGARAR
jgi:hypothetical protein